VEVPPFIHVPSHDFAAIVDSFRHGTGRSWRIELRVISRSVPEKAMTACAARSEWVLSTYEPTICPESLIPNRTVPQNEWSFGTLIGVEMKLPDCQMKPCHF
jgi:hypothetical protein